MRQQFTRRKFRSHPEYDLAKAIAVYLQLQYPGIEYRFDMAGLNLSKAQAGMNKVIQKRRAWPDLFIAEARHGHPAMFIELKAEGERIFKKDGKTYASEHLAEQASVLKMLADKNYSTGFVVGFDNAKKMLDWYLNENKPVTITNGHKNKSL